MSLLRQKSITYAIFLAAVLALLIPVIIIENRVLQQTEGNFTLPQDESFINISVGKNLAFFGVWGLSKYGFQPAASSLLYPIVLVPIFFIAGSHLLIPLIVNTIFAVLLLFTLQRALIRQGLPPLLRLAILLLLIFLIPLPLLIIGGSEYMLFLLLLTLSITTFVRAGVKDPAINQLPWPVYVYASLLVATRFEGILFIVIACILLLYWQQRRLALQLLLAGLLPILLFGSISLSKEHAFIPKALFQTLGAGMYTAAIAGIVLIIVLLTAPLHYKKRQWIALVLVGCIAVIRTITSLGETKQLSVNTYHEQIKTAQFVHRYYNRMGISLNEVGAASFFSEGRKVDLTGIANTVVGKKETETNAATLSPDSLSHRLGIKVAILSGTLPNPAPLGHRWDRVASWNNPKDMVSFYVTDTFASRLLKQHLREYEKRLPTNVQVRYY